MGLLYLFSTLPYGVGMEFTFRRTNTPARTLNIIPVCTYKPLRYVPPLQPCTKANSSVELFHDPHCFGGRRVGKISYPLCEADRNNNSPLPPRTNLAVPAKCGLNPHFEFNVEQNGVPPRKTQGGRVYCIRWSASAKKDLHWEQNLQISD